MFIAGLLVVMAGFSQSIDKIINAGEVERIEKTLSSDDMQGRRTFTPGIDKAADFIAAEFKKTGIQPINGDSYFQEFAMLRLKMTSATGTLNGQPLDMRSIAVLTINPELSVDQNSGYQKITVSATDTLYPLVLRLLDTDKNYFLVVDSAQRNLFNSLKRFRQNTFPYKANIVAVLGTGEVSTYSVDYKQEVTTMPLKNVVGILPGKKKKDEYVIFSGHYDHLGIGRPNAEGDSIYNGANDDAAGTTAVIMLANYFAKKHDNDRTIIFAAFTGEEIGGYGSRYFSQQFDPAKVMAMFNIEMIGTDSKWGDKICLHYRL